MCAKCSATLAHALFWFQAIHFYPNTTINTFFVEPSVCESERSREGEENRIRRRKKSEQVKNRAFVIWLSVMHNCFGLLLAFRSKPNEKNEIQILLCIAYYKIQHTRLASHWPSLAFAAVMRLWKKTVFKNSCSTLLTRINIGTLQIQQLTLINSMSLNREYCFGRAHCMSVYNVHLYTTTWVFSSVSSIQVR